MTEDHQDQPASEGAKAPQYPNVPGLKCLEFLAPHILEGENHLAPYLLENGALLKPRTSTSQLCRRILKMRHRRRKS